MVSAAVAFVRECVSAATMPLMTKSTTTATSESTMLLMTPSAAMTPTMTPVIMIVVPTVAIAPRMTPSVSRPVSVCRVSAAVAVTTRIFNVVAALRRKYAQSERQSCQD
jgi:hypothetical protein